MKENITNKILEINCNMDYDNFIIIHNFTLIILTENKFLNNNKKKGIFSVCHISYLYDHSLRIFSYILIFIS